MIAHVAAHEVLLPLLNPLRSSGVDDDRFARAEHDAAGLVAADYAQGGLRRGGKRDRGAGEGLVGDGHGRRGGLRQQRERDEERHGRGPFGVSLPGVAGAAALISAMRLFACSSRSLWSKSLTMRSYDMCDSAERLKP